MFFPSEVYMLISALVLVGVSILVAAKVKEAQPVPVKARHQK